MLDFVESADVSSTGTELRIAIQPEGSFEAPTVRSVLLTGVADGVESSYQRVCEVRISHAGVGIPHGRGVRFQLSIWQAGLPMEALPPQGWIDFSTSEPAEMVF